MSKLNQLNDFQRWGVPTSPFTSIHYEDFQKGRWSVGHINFPVAVRSSFTEEDGQQYSHAGAFKTILKVSKEQLADAIRQVFDSYPGPDGTSVIIQQMVSADYSGVLFASRKGIWKMEIGKGLGEGIVGGKYNPDTLIIPKFNGKDHWMSALYAFWRLPDKYQSIVRPLVSLSYYAGKLLKKNADTPYGLDIEWAVQGKKLFLLQARPITSPEEEEEVLTTANHREILPPRPSILMTEVISTSGKKLFDYYRRLDVSLQERSFVLTAEGMPWINLSALLDMMVSWGLPSNLVVRSIGAEDFYRVGLRPHQAITKVRVFLKALNHQLSARRIVKKWLRGLPEKVQDEKKRREVMWREDPGGAFDRWFESFRNIYVELVQHMQLLTGAMSGPLSVLDRLGVLPQLAAGLKAKSQSTDYYAAFQDLLAGRITREAFLEQYGHRGFYESDIGQPRFAELSEKEWALLAGGKQANKENNPRIFSKLSTNIWAFLARPLFRAVHLREQLRHEIMEQFWVYRKELLAELAHLGHSDIKPWMYTYGRLLALLKGEISKHDLLSIRREPQSGWDKDTFLLNKSGRRMDLPMLYRKDSDRQHAKTGVGIYPGRVRGQVWRVHEAGLDTLHPPPFETVILVADALDPGWIPYFSQVDGVLAYVGGLLSHASIILRESALPAITQIPAALELQTGDWIEMDGKNGLIKKIE